MKTFIFLLVLLFAYSVYGQINYFQGSVDEAANRARKENKIIMAIIESETCTQCNEVATSGLSEAVLKKNDRKRIYSDKAECYAFVNIKKQSNPAFGQKLMGHIFPG